MSHIELTVPSLFELQTHRSEKWREFPHDVLPLPVAEMDFPVAEPIRELLLEMVSKSDLGYLGPVPELPIAFAEFSLSRWSWKVDASQVHIATDVGVAAVEVLRLLTTPGDKVIINSPVYHNFSNWIREAKAEIVDVPFRQAGVEWSFDFNELEDAYKSGVKVHLLCNPHNPLGRVYSRDELLHIAQLAAKYGVLILSDEIHGPLTFPEAEFVPFLSLGTVAQKVCITVTAASKAWNIAGLKCALIISQNDEINSILARLPIATHYRASLLGAFASVAAFKDGSAWLDEVMLQLDSNRKYLRELLTTHLPQVRYEIPRMGYLAWLDFSAYGIARPAYVLLNKGKIAVNEGSSFGPNGVGFVRLNFATSKEILAEAVKRMSEAMA